ncbi:MAG: hypothetical protein FJ011_27930 [Chloroflexi bacterium]|nr:hypothetical protein [Chloroflexota bacterium]
MPFPCTKPQPLISLAVAFLLSAVALTACWPSDPLAQAAIRRHGVDMMNATDLPLRWGHRWSDSIKTTDGFGQLVSYYGANPRSQPFVKVSQSLVYYRAVELSQVAYQVAVAEAIPAAYAHKWVRPPELDFAVRANEITIACLPGRIEGIYHRSCKVIARYNDVVMTLYANVFEDRWLTMAQFRRLLERVDARVNSMGVR